MPGTGMLPKHGQNRLAKVGRTSRENTEIQQFREPGSKRIGHRPGQSGPRRGGWQPHTD